MQGLRIIMLGKLRSGKTTVGKLICETLKEVKDISLQSRPLAKPIYEEAQDFYARHGLTWRKNRRLLEGIGEALNDDYPGGDKIIELYAKDFNVNENIYVEDCRRLTQARFFADLNLQAENAGISSRSIFIRVTATDAVRKARCKPGEWAEGHVTDVELDNWPADIEIENNGDDLVELKQKIRRFVESIKV